MLSQLKTAPKVVGVKQSKKAIRDGSAAAVFVAADAEARGWKESREVDARSLATLKAGGMSVEEPSPQLKADLQKVGQTVLKEWLDKAGDDGQTMLNYYKAAK